MVQKVKSSFLSVRFSRDHKLLVEAVVRWWIDNFPEIPLQYSMPHLGAMADAAVQRANRHRIHDQPDVCAFALLMWLYGPTFDKHPQIAMVLASPSAADERLAHVFNDTPEPVWDAIHAARDESQWFEMPTDSPKTLA